MKKKEIVKNKRIRNEKEKSKLMCDCSVVIMWREKILTQQQQLNKKNKTHTHKTDMRRWKIIEKRSKKCACNREKI